MAFTIRDATRRDAAQLADLISDAFLDVAVRHGLTPANCPTHPSNCTEDWIESALDKGARYYVLEAGGIPCGCVALEEAEPGVHHLGRLAVLPKYRNWGLGATLVNHAVAEAHKMGGRRVEIGIIAAETGLREWYERQGFSVERTAEFEHLPFEVTFMARPLDN